MKALLNNIKENRFAIVLIYFAVILASVVFCGTNVYINAIIIGISFVCAILAFGYILETNLFTDSERKFLNGIEALFTEE